MNLRDEALFGELVDISTDCDLGDSELFRQIGNPKGPCVSDFGLDRSFTLSSKHRQSRFLSFDYNGISRRHRIPCVLFWSRSVINHKGASAPLKDFYRPFPSLVGNEAVEECAQQSRKIVVFEQSPDIPSLS